MKLIVAICVSLLCYFSNAQNNPFAGRVFLLTEYDSAGTKISLINTAEGGIYMKFHETTLNYSIGNSYTFSYTRVNDSVYIKKGINTLVAYFGVTGMLEYLMKNKLWKSGSIKKVGFSFRNDSLILANDSGETWILVDSAAIQQSVESRKILRLDPGLKAIFTVKSDSHKRFYRSPKNDTSLFKNTWGKPNVFITNYFMGSPVYLNLDFDTLKLGEKMYNCIDIDKKGRLSTSLYTTTGGDCCLNISNEIWGKGDPISVRFRFKYRKDQFEYFPFKYDSMNSLFPVRAKIEYLKRKKVNGKLYKNIYVFSFDLDQNTEPDLIRKCYWSSGFGPIELEFMNGEKLFLINEVKEEK